MAHGAAAVSELHPRMQWGSGGRGLVGPVQYYINGSTIHDEPHAPFSGMKDSGMGREGGQWSMDDLTQLKWITIQQGEAHYPF
jgi:Aldehyde dehydrogenase family